MKFSTTTIATVALVAGVLFGYTFTGFYSIKAQNMTAPVNMTSDKNLQTNTLQLSANEKNGIFTWANKEGTNPILNFKQNADNVVQLKNPTDSVHQLVITSAGKQVASSGDLQPGKSGQLSFANVNQGETLEYHCLYHPSTMKGTITISS